MQENVYVLFSRAKNVAARRQRSQAPTAIHPVPADVDTHVSSSDSGERMEDVQFSDLVDAVQAPPQDLHAGDVADGPEAGSQDGGFAGEDANPGLHLCRVPVSDM